MKLRITLVLISCLVSVVTGVVLARGGKGGPDPRAAGSAVRIGLSLDTLKEARWQGDLNYFKQRAAELGAKVIDQSANGDDVRQISDVESLISNGIDVLVIVPHNGAAMARAVEKAHEAHIPVLAYDRLITQADLDLYLTFDNVKVGELQARFLVDLWAKNPAAKRRLVRIYGSKTDNNALLFKQGQDRVLEPLIAEGKVEVVHEDWAQDWRPENAKRIANAALTKVGREMDAILASNDGTAGGAIQALVEEGLAGQIVVTGQDADLAACQRIMAGTQAMTIYKPLRQIAFRGAELAVKLGRREPVVARATVNNEKIEVPSVLLDVIAVTKENMADTVVKDGFHRAEQLTAP